MSSPDRESDAWVEVSPKTMEFLRKIAEMLGCTVAMALEEAIEEFSLGV